MLIHIQEDTCGQCFKIEDMERYVLFCAHILDLDQPNNLFIGGGATWILSWVGGGGANAHTHIYVY